MGAPSAHYCDACGDHVGVKTTYVRVGQDHYWVCYDCEDDVRDIIGEEKA